MNPRQRWLVFFAASTVVVLSVGLSTYPRDKQRSDRPAAQSELQNDLASVTPSSAWTSSAHPSEHPSASRSPSLSLEPTDPTTEYPSWNHFNPSLQPTLGPTTLQSIPSPPNRSETEMPSFMISVTPSLRQFKGSSLPSQSFFPSIGAMPVSSTAKARSTVPTAHSPSPAPITTASPSVTPSSLPTQTPTLGKVSSLPSSHPSSKASQSLVFFVVADAPYSTEEADELLEQVSGIDGADFIVHLGDIRSARRNDRCQRQVYQWMKSTLRQANIPAFIVVGGEFNKETQRYFQI